MNYLVVFNNRRDLVNHVDLLDIEYQKSNDIAHIGDDLYYFRAIQTLDDAYKLAGIQFKDVEYIGKPSTKIIEYISCLIRWVV